MVDIIRNIQWKQGLLLYITASIVLIADQITKSLVRANMDLGESIPEEGRFRLTYSTNSGSIFGLDLNSTFLTIMAIVVVIVIVFVYFRYLSSCNRITRIGLGLLTGGALGNFADRVRFGEVTDFIDVRLWGDFHWATFNVADSALTTGVIVLMICFAFMAKQFQ